MSKKEPQRLEFYCDNCGADVPIQMERRSVTEVIDLVEVFDDGDFSANDVNSLGGVIHHFVCQGCNRVIRDGHKVVKSMDGLVKWMKKNQPISPDEQKSEE